MRALCEMLGKCSNSHMPLFSSDPRSILSRAPKRITITIPHATFEAIAQRSDEEGRSMSNLAAYILEKGLKE